MTASKPKRWGIEAIAVAIRLTGLPWLIRHTFARRRVTVVLYHDPRPEFFQRHLAYLAKRYRFITMGRLVDAIRGGKPHRLPPRSLIITLDDGHAGNYCLLPILRKYQVTPTIYVCSRVVNTRRHFWFERCGEHCEILKAYPHADRLEALKAGFGYTPATEYPAGERQALSAAELTEMAPHVEFGSHTCLHPLLTTTSDAHSRYEILQSKYDVEQLTGRSCFHFAFPNGDYGDREVRYVRGAGYATARTTGAGWNDHRSDPFRLKTTAITGDFSTNVLAAQLCGVTLFVRNLLKSLRRRLHVLFDPLPRQHAESSNRHVETSTRRIRQSGINTARVADFRQGRRGLAIEHNLRNRE